MVERGGTIETMVHFSYADSPYIIREDLKQAYRDYWEALAAPGNWWSGAERVAIAEEVRYATTCAYCAERKNALSPYNFPGEHTHGGKLPERIVDAVHRIITDQGRITQAWIDDNAAAGFSVEQYVELLGIAVTVFSIDEFNRALSLPLEPLPEPQAGEPDGYRPAEATHGTGFVPMIPDKGPGSNEQDLWPPGRSANVLRALSLVPDAVRCWRNVSNAQYLNMGEIMKPASKINRTLDRLQIETVAGRVSSINECFY